MNDSNHPAHRFADRSGNEPVSAEDVFAWVREHDEADAVVDGLGELLHRRRVRRFQALGIAALLMVSVGALFIGLRSTPDTQDAAPVAAGEVVIHNPDVLNLPDGSLAELNDRAQLRTQYSGELRQIALFQGKAHFQVTRDVAKPFVVVARGVEIWAVGTAFVVDVEDGNLEVLVTEGRVAIRNASGHAPARVRSLENEPAVAELDVGGRATFTGGAAHEPVAKPEIGYVSPEQMHRLLSWRAPRFEFRSTSLAEVIEMFNGYNRSRNGALLEMKSPAMGSLELSGVLRANDTETLLLLLEAEFGIHADRQPGVISLRQL